MIFRLDWHHGRWLALLFLSCSPLVARNTACTAVWSSVVDRLTENRFDEETALLQLKFTEVPELVFIDLGKVPEPELEAHLPAYVRDLLARHPEVSVPEILAEAKSLPFDSESRLRQESEYWHLRYQHFWGGGLQHPRPIRRLAVLEVRA